MSSSQDFYAKFNLEKVRGNRNFPIQWQCIIACWFAYRLLPENASIECERTVNIEIDGKKSTRRLDIFVEYGNNKYAIEVDEVDHLNQRDDDLRRQHLIEEEYGYDFFRVCLSSTVGLKDQVDEIVDKIIEKKELNSASIVNAANSISFEGLYAELGKSQRNGRLLKENVFCAWLMYEYYNNLYEAQLHCPIPEDKDFRVDFYLHTEKAGVVFEFFEVSHIGNEAEDESRKVKLLDLPEITEVITIREYDKESHEGLRAVEVINQIKKQKVTGAKGIGDCTDVVVKYLTGTVDKDHLDRQIKIYQKLDNSKITIMPSHLYNNNGINSKGKKNSDECSVAYHHTDVRDCSVVAQTKKTVTRLVVFCHGNPYSIADHLNKYAKDSPYLFEGTENKYISIKKSDWRGKKSISRKIPEDGEHEVLVAKQIELIFSYLPDNLPVDVIEGKTSQK